jgi:hypothetical protein
MSKKKGKSNTKSNKTSKSKIKVTSTKARNPNMWKHQGR